MAAKLTTRPAETGGAAGTIGLLVAYISGVTDPETVVLIGAGIGLIPSVVTTLVDNGGIVGVVKLLVQGRKT